MQNYNLITGVHSADSSMMRQECVRRVFDRAPAPVETNSQRECACRRRAGRERVMAEQVAAEEELRKQEKPQCAKEKAMTIAAELFGLELEVAKVKQLESYDDVNYYLRCLDGAQYCSDEHCSCKLCFSFHGDVALSLMLLANRILFAGTSSRSTTGWSRITRCSWRA
jgi:hypothetical protein